MKPKTILCLALTLSSVCTQPATTNHLSEVETLARIPPLQTVNSILFSPDGKAIATLRGEGTSWHEWSKPLTLQLWAVPRGTLLWTAKESAFKLLAFSPDSTRLVGIAENGTIVFWNAADGKIKRQLPRQNDSIGPAAFLPNGQSLLTAVNKFQEHMFPGAGEIQLWETKTGRLIRTLKGQTNVISALAVSPDGKTLAIASEDAGGSGVDAKVNVLDIETDSLRRTLRFDTNAWTIGSLAFSPDGKTLVAGGGVHAGTGEVRFWNVVTGQLQRTITDADLGSALPRISMEPFVAYSPDGKMVAIVGQNQEMILWNVAAGKWQGSLEAHTPSRPGCYVIRFVEDGLLLANINDFQQVEVQFWNYK